MLNDHLAPLRRALRPVRHRPGFALLIVVIVTVVIGATATILAVVDSVLLQALPYPDADRLVLIWDTNVERNVPEMNVSLPKALDLEREVDALEVVGAASSGVNLVLSGLGEPRRLTATMVSAELLRLTGVTPARGRLFTADDERVDAEHRVALISHDLWQRQFAGSETIVGRSLTLNGGAYTVVGVMPRDFVDFPFPAQSTDIWLPVTMAAEIYGVDDLLSRRTARIFVALGLLRTGASPVDALAELEGLNANLAAAYPDSDAGWSSRLEPLRELFVGDLQPPLLGLTGGAVLLVLIGCANVASLLLVRASRRQVELATRLALGASRARLLLQAVGESLTLVALGGALGISLAAVGTGRIAGAVPVDWPRHIQIEARPTVFVAATVLTLAIGVIAALLAVLPTIRPGASAALPSAARTVEPSGGALRRGLVVAEVAVAVTLLVGAGLTMHSLARLRNADFGFSPAGLVALEIDVPAASHTPERLGVLAGELERHVEKVAGVADGYIWSPQVPGQSTWYTALRPQDRPELRDDELPLVRFHYVGPGALEGIGLRFLAGRDISREDNADGAGAIVLSESAARVLWPDDDAVVGRRVRRWNRDRWLTVVGVTEDAKHSGRQGPGTEDNIDVYFSFLQEPQNDIVVLARTDGEASQVVDAARAALEAAAPGLPVFGAETLTAQIAEQEAIPRFTAMLAAVFAATALFLASIGLYGVLAYAVCLRTREIGLRMALGAGPGSILRDIVRQGVRLTLVGVAIGVGGALLVTRWLETLLFEVSPADPATFAGAVALLVLVAASASFIPARRALRIDPQEALRSD